MTQYVMSSICSLALCFLLINPVNAIGSIWKASGSRLGFTWTTFSGESAPSGLNPVLSVTEGDLITFDLSGLSALHPFRLTSTNPSGTISLGTPTSCVSTSGYYGAGCKLIWTVPRPVTGTTYEYQCPVLAFGATINVVALPTTVSPSIWGVFGSLNSFTFTTVYGDISAPSGPNPTLHFTEGQLITFDLSGLSVTHPFYIIRSSSTGSSPVTLDVASCTTGFGPGCNITWTVPTPSTGISYTYQCGVHQAGGSIEVISSASILSADISDIPSPTTSPCADKTNIIIGSMSAGIAVLLLSNFVLYHVGYRRGSLGQIQARMKSDTTIAWATNPPQP